MRPVALLELLVIACGLLLGMAVLLLWRRRYDRLATRFRERVESSLITIPMPQAYIPVRSSGPPQLIDIDGSNLLISVLRYTAAAGILLPRGTLIIMAIGYAVTVLVVVTVTGGPWVLRVLGAVVMLSLPVLYVRRRYRKTERSIDRQLPAALDVMARSLQAGKALPACWHEMGEVLDAPLGPLCRDIHLKISYGGDLDEVLHDTAQRIPSEDVKFFFSALSIFTKTGGNLVELLQDQSQLLRQRLAMADRIRALSAESRMSAWIMGLMPFGVTGLMLLISPRTMSLLWTTPLGIGMLQFGIFMQLLGVLWIARLASRRI